MRPTLQAPQSSPSLETETSVSIYRNTPLSRLLERNHCKDEQFVIWFVTAGTSQHPPSLPLPHLLAAHDRYAANVGTVHPHIHSLNSQRVPREPAVGFCNVHEGRGVTTSPLKEDTMSVTTAGPVFLLDGSGPASVKSTTSVYDYDSINSWIQQGTPLILTFHTLQSQQKTILPAPLPPRAWQAPGILRRR